MSCLYDELESHRNNKNDKRIFGLVLQGGGMRGVYSCAAIAPLAKHGFQDTFDHIVGSSAGAINGAYLMGGDPDSYKIYTDDLTNKNFVNLTRRDKKVDIDYLIDKVLQEKHALNKERLQGAHTKLHIILTNARTGKQEVISNHHDFLEIYEELRATAALPIFYDKKVKVGDTEYVDGAVANSLPVDVAIGLGCTDIVIVMTRQISSYNFNKGRTWLVNHLVRGFAGKQSVAVRKILLTDKRVLEVNLRRLTYAPKDVRIYMLQPSDEKILVSLATADKPKIQALARLGVQDMNTFLRRLL